MKIFRSLIPILSAILIFAGTATAQAPKILKQTNAHSSGAWSGDQLYREFCAVCHGIDATGNGPAASALKTNPTDLTLFNRRNSSPYPELKLRNLLIQPDAIAAHGSSEMPVWGDIFKSISANRTFAQMRIDALVRYLATIQR